MQKHHFTTQKTARYFTHGELTERTKYVWFVLHGYGQLADRFLSFFESLPAKKSEEHFFISPEGLSRFYWKGFGGKPVASWMTSEDREEEIADYLAYLNALYADLVPKNLNLKKIALGFSQGTATVTRWVADGKSQFDHMVLWSGALAHDIDWNTKGEAINEMSNFLVIGKGDEFISAADVKKQREYLNQIGFEYQFYEFEGGHELDSDTFLKIQQKVSG